MEIKTIEFTNWSGRYANKPVVYAIVSVRYGGKCNFNQTNVLSRSQVEKVFGDKWEQFNKAREKADLQKRLLSNYFNELILRIII